MIAIEVAAFNIESAMNAQKGGADRVELCDNPSEGGTTPSFGVMEVVRQGLSIDVYAMIRPRGGDFVFSAYEYFAMKRDIEMCKRASLDGVVLGILKPDGTIDKGRCKALIDAARPMKVTCHRAFDFTRDAFEALEDCIDVGFNRILTSGRLPSAEEGADLIKQLVQRAGSRISIMAGVGINEKNVAGIIQRTGVSEVHLSAKEFMASAYPGHNPKISLIDSLRQDSGMFLTNENKVRAIRQVVDLHHLGKA
jgi:copper homeostasis protein